MEKESKLVELVKELEEAKKAVQFCLDNESGNVNFKGITYWAEKLEELRKQIKELI